MIVSSPTNLANAVAPFAPVGRLPVGEENPENKDSRFKSIEASAESANAENRRGPDEHPNDVEERERLRGVDDDSVRREEQQQRQEEAEKQQELEEIKRLAARDREVRAHEAAHAAVGGRFANTPQYQFTRGPDGVNYAVSGEVDISAGEVAGDPQATLAKARHIKAAANAPADPSLQDRRIAAEAASMEAKALAEIADSERRQTLEGRQRVEREKAEAADKQEQNALADESAEPEHPVTNRKQDAEATRLRQKDLQRHLAEIGVLASGRDTGSHFDQTV